MKALRSMVLVVIGLFSVPADAQEAWLMTYGPGAEVWERFGHNALWIRDREAGLDHAFSFGYFEMDRPGFHLDFARGIMEYYGSAASIEREFEFYRQRDRTIRGQKLDLDAGQIAQLYELLDGAIFPVPQYYDYDYYYANCSTWLRDLLDEVLDGALEEELVGQPARQNFRDHTSRLNRERFWLHTGLMVLLGPEVDRQRSAWEEGFLPAGLAEWIGRVEIDGQPLVTETRSFYESRAHHPPQRARGLWWSYGVLGVISALVVLLPFRFGGSFLTLLPWRMAVTGFFAAGIVIVLMWTATAHYVVAGNLMLFILHPLWLVFLLPLPRGVRIAVWWILAAAAAAGTLLMATPAGPQYRGDVMLWLVPLCAAMLAVARRESLFTGGAAKGPVRSRS